MSYLPDFDAQKLIRTSINLIVNKIAVDYVAKMVKIPPSIHKYGIDQAIMYPLTEYVLITAESKLMPKA